MTRAVTVILGSICAAATLAAQEPTRATLRGVVVSETGERVAYAVVLLQPGFPQQFADDGGGFVIAGVTPGAYRLLVRQVGFVPFDSAVTISSATPPLRIALRRVAVQLAAVTVQTSRRCLQPGVPDSTVNPELAAVFEQLRLNAERYRLLIDQYPFRYVITRQLGEVRKDRGETTRTDTLVLRSNSRWPYEPGRVVSDDPIDGRRGVRNVHLPGLADIADPAFQNYHCFHLVGLDTLDGQSLVRLDFRAAESLREPDVNGTAYLDPVSYQVRSTSVTLTHLERAVTGVTSWVATVTFRELRSNLIVIDRMSALTTNQPGRDPWAIVGRTELQRLSRVEFDRPLP